MDQSLAVIDPALLAIVQGVTGPGGALVPFAREILLVECQIAGTSYRGIKTDDAGLAPGAALVLKREPANAHDPLAIMVFSEAGAHLGYVPRAKNEALARLMDAGKWLVARLASKGWQGDWLLAEMQVSLRDE